MEAATAARIAERLQAVREVFDLTLTLSYEERGLALKIGRHVASERRADSVFTSWYNIVLQSLLMVSL